MWTTWLSSMANGDDKERLILARELMKDALGDNGSLPAVVEEMKGSELVGKRYPAAVHVSCLWTGGLLLRCLPPTS